MGTSISREEEHAYCYQRLPLSVLTPVRKNGKRERKEMS